MFRTFLEQSCSQMSELCTPVFIPLTIYIVKNNPNKQLSVPNNNKQPYSDVHITPNKTATKVTNPP